MNLATKLIKSGSITFEEVEIIKSDADKVLALAKIANQDRVKPVRIDNKTVILVKPDKKDAFEKYIAKRQKYAKPINSRKFAKSEDLATIA